MRIRPRIFPPGKRKNRGTRVFTVPLTPRGEERLGIAENIYRPFQRAGRHDLLSGKVETPAEESWEFPLWTLRGELVHILTQLHSVLRREDTNYYLDLLFGGLLGWNHALRTGRLHLSLSSLLTESFVWESLSRSERRWVGFYLQNSLEVVDAVPTRRIWRELYPLLDREAGFTRRWLAAGRQRPGPFARDEVSSFRRESLAAGRKVGIAECPESPGGG